MSERSNTCRLFSLCTVQKVITAAEPHTPRRAPLLPCTGGALDGGVPVLLVVRWDLLPHQTPSDEDDEGARREAHSESIKEARDTASKMKP